MIRIKFFNLINNSCFLSKFGVLMGAFLAPILVIVVLNVIIFICVVIVVIRHARDKAARTKRPISNKSILRLMISMSGVLFLFGITWVFFVLTFSVAGLRETFQLLFTVFNSLQGFFVFAFILFTEGFSYWKTFLTCETCKSKIVQSSLEKKQCNTDPLATAPPTEDRRNDSEVSQINLTDKSHTNNVQMDSTKESFNSKKDSDFQLSTGVATSSTKTVNNRPSSEHQNINIVYQSNRYDTTGSQEQQLKKNKSNVNPIPLKVVVRRYSTKMQKRHHVEEVETNIESSDSDTDESAAAE